jgi:UTP--glucose-1-phosphate uridylyltransferase
MLRKIRHISDLTPGRLLRQKGSSGSARGAHGQELIGSEPFAVILSDDVVWPSGPASASSCTRTHQTHSSVVAVMESPRSDRSLRHHRSEPAGDDPDHGRLHRLTGVVEKPPAGRRRQPAIIGRYVLTPKI